MQPVNADDSRVLEVRGDAYLFLELRSGLEDPRAVRAARAPHCLEKNLPQGLPVRHARTGQKQVEPVVGLSQVLAVLVSEPLSRKEDRSLGNLATRLPPCAFAPCRVRAASSPTREGRMLPTEWALGEQLSRSDEQRKGGGRFCPPTWRVTFSGRDQG